MDLLYILLIIPAIFILGSFLASQLSGWKRLEQKYYYSYKYQGPLLHPMVALMGLGKYSGILNVGYTPQGLYLFPSFFFQLFHKPLLIPWNEITTGHKTYMLVTYTALKFNVNPPVALLVTDKFAERLFKAVYGDSFQL